MKSFWMATKIAGVFLLVLLAFVSVTLHRFVRIVMHPVVHGHLSMGEAHDRFVTSVLAYGAIAMLLAIALAVYVTGPLRRMSRSMDRVAAGDLDHRVAVRGNDEASAMGRSFNTMADRVRAMLVEKQELIAAVSHELRSPLARMRVSLELLREGREPQERIADLEGDVDAIDELVEELLLASRIELGSASLARQSQELEALCREAWRRVEPGAAEANTTLRLDLAADARAVEADRRLAVRLLGNLFENSARYAPGGTVSVESVRDGDRVRVAVSDTGPGVPDDDLERLFEPFFRADRSRSRRTGASGLGLMIARRAVEAHGGTMRARRAEPHGLRIELDLPASA